MKKFHLIIFVIIVLGIISLVRESLFSIDQKTQTLNTNTDTPIKRIICLSKSPVPFIVLGLDESDKRLIGINPAIKKTMDANILGKFFPRFQTMSSAVCTDGFAINIEEIIRLNPDLILHWKMYQSDIVQMRKLGFKVIDLDYDGSEQTDRDIVNRIAGAMHRKEKADSIMKWREKALHQIKNISNSIKMDVRPKVIFLYSYENFNVGGENSYENFIINLVGGRNMGDGLGLARNVDIEQILEWNPDVILFGGWREKPNPVDIYQNLLLQEVNAVKNKRIFKMPVWASNEIVLAWKWMAEILHPQKYNFNIREEIKSTYKWQYNVELTEDNIDEVLLYTVNILSPFYTTFKR